MEWVPKTLVFAKDDDHCDRIAVTVDMIATGTDIRPLECVMFMRDVKSQAYYEQMKGRGTRMIRLDLKLNEQQRKRVDEVGNVHRQFIFLLKQLDLRTQIK